MSLATDGENGFLIPRNDENQSLLIRRLKQLLTDKSLCEKMGDASERRFLRNFTFSPMYQKTLVIFMNKLFQSLLRRVIKLQLLRIRTDDELVLYKEIWDDILANEQNDNPFIEYAWFYNWWITIGRKELSGAICCSKE
ncbi:hypothetical protein LSPH24S_10130 [Lysinibacillus sphaericus]